MRALLFTVILFPFAHLSVGQTFQFYDDSAQSTMRTFHNAKGVKQWITKDHVTLVTNKFRLSASEVQILEFESLECKALLERDTTALKNLWMKDFTLDEAQNEVHAGKIPIPYYVGIHRIIEKLVIADNVAYVSGLERLGRLKSDGSLEGAIEREFHHVWMRKLFAWKLVSKTDRIH